MVHPMTHTTPTQPLTPAPFAGTDPRATFARAVALGGAVVANVAPDQLGLPTPCDAYNVRDLLGHVLAVLHRVGALGRGEDPFSVGDTVAAPGDDWPAAWATAAHACQEAWADDATLARSVVLPWAELDGAQALDMYTSELTTHTWDLATATGQRPAWDDAVVAVALASIQAMLPAEGRIEAFETAFANLPAEYQGERAFPFAAAVEVPDGAPLIDRLVAWTGRTP